jgi:hypothetical protein
LFKFEDTIAEAAQNCDAIVFVRAGQCIVLRPAGDGLVEMAVSEVYLEYAETGLTRVDVTLKEPPFREADDAQS